MGINGLLPQLKSIASRCHVSNFRGQRAAVDAYVLLHRGAYTCAREICEGGPTARCTDYCMGKIQLLINNGVIPVVVFDGDKLPNKDEEEKTRARSREDSLAKARSLWQQGNKLAAFECYQRAVDITPAVAKCFINALKGNGVEFIVAPYEADAQMAYLAMHSMVDVVITEDSDLLTYGCPRVLFKMDKTGGGDLIELRNLTSAQELNFSGFSQDMFLEMCILAGCDFVKGLPGIGIKKAHQQIKQRRSFVKVIKNLRFSGTAVPPDYERKVQRAIWTFKHQRVFCPKRKKVVHLHEVADSSLQQSALVPSAAQLLDGENDFLGPCLPDRIAQAIATGDLDPVTKDAYEILADQPCTSLQAVDQFALGSQAGTRSASVQDSLWQILEGKDVVQGKHQVSMHQQSGGAKRASGSSLFKHELLHCSSSAKKEFKRPRLSIEDARPRIKSEIQNLSEKIQVSYSNQNVMGNDVDCLVGADACSHHEHRNAHSKIAAIHSAIQRSNFSTSSLLKKLQGDVQGPGLDALLYQPSMSEIAAHSDAAQSPSAEPTPARSCKFLSPSLSASPVVYYNGSPAEQHTSPIFHLRATDSDDWWSVQQLAQDIPAQQLFVVEGPTCSIAYVDRYDEAAKAALARVSDQAKDASYKRSKTAKPRKSPHLQNHSQLEASTQTLKKPFNIPRQTGRKSSGGLTGQKQSSKQQLAVSTNRFSKFICKNTSHSP